MRSSRARRRSACAAAALALVAVAVPAAGGQSTSLAGDPAFGLVDIGNFKSPVHVDNAPGATGLLFVVERRGTIAVLEDGAEQEVRFLDIRDIVQSGGEEGLLSVAFHPDYATNRRFYVYYTTNAGDNRVDQFKRKQSDPLRASLDSRKKVIKIGHPSASNHNGGQLQFHPTDGHLYAATGDGGNSDNAQDPDSLLGKLLRIDPIPAGGYEVPPDNPFAGGGGRGEIMALGLRNPWRFSFDSATGDIVIGDVGETDWEEVDYETAPDLSGASFGWDRYEGLADHDVSDPIPPDNQFPIEVFDHSGMGDGFCAITGGYVVHDPDLPALAGQYLFSDLCANEIRAIQVPSGADGTDVGVSSSSTVSFGEGENGQIYVVSLDGDVFTLEEGA